MAGDDLSRLSKRDRKRLKREVGRELKRQLRETKAEGQRLAAERAQLDRDRRHHASDVYRQVKATSKRTQESTQAARAKRDRAAEVVDAIGYDLMFKNGICEVEQGLFSETIEFDDITYQNARDSDQLDMLKVIFDLHNGVSDRMCLQYGVINSRLRREQVGTRTFFDPGAQATGQGAADAVEMNEILNAKLLEGVSNITRRRLLTVSTLAVDADEAVRSLAGFNTMLATNFERLRCGWRVLDGAERLSIVNSMLRPGTELDFDFDRDLSVASPLTTKDFVAPASLDFAPGGSDFWFRSNGKCCQVLVMRALDSPLDDRCIANIADLGMPLEVSWFLQPINKVEAINYVATRATMIGSEIVQEQQKAVKNGYDYSLLPPELVSNRESVNDILSQLKGEEEGKASQRLFQFTGVVWTWADDFETLTDQVRQIVSAASTSGIMLEPLEMRQRQGFNTALPLGLNHVEISRQLMTNETCILVPFATTELDDEGGNWYYQNKLSGNLVLGNRARLSSPVGFVSGKTGSGKGFFVKNEIESTLLSKPRDQVFIFDRAGEYLLLTEHWGGQCATFGTGHGAHLNPLGMMGLEDRSDEAQVAFKSDAILAQAGASAEESGMPLTDEERSIIQRCVERVFLEARIRGREPLLEDLYQALLSQPEQAAQSIALRYERFCRGATSFFNYPGNVDFDARIVDLNLKEVPESMLVFALVTMCEAVRFQMYRNHERGIRTWLYIEEMESLFKYSTVLNYFARFSRECRKFGMYLTGITQSTEAMMRNPDASSIVKQSDFVVLLRQSKEDRDYWAEALGLSPLQISSIDDATPRGNGLLVFGDSRIPIKGEFPTDSYLYDLYSTDPNEAEARRARLAGEGR